MKKYCFNGLFLLMISTLMISCGGKMVQKTSSSFEPYKFKANQYKPKVDDFAVILDTSFSMSRKYCQKKKVDIAKEFLTAMNQSLPELNYNGALVTFGPGDSTRVDYGLTRYSTSGFASALNATQAPSGNSSDPLAKAINAAAGELKNSQGQIAVVLVSDGELMETEPITAAKNMKAQFGNRLCIYTVLVGDDPVGQAFMEQVATAGECGFSVSANELKDSGDMGNFVKNVFLAGVAKPSDSDGDGVTDDMDRCPDTPKGVTVDARGCPIDSDGDGVADYLDKCPNTPKGAKVNAQGCWILGGVLFDTNKSEIKPEFNPELDAVVTVLEKNLALNVKIKGHTDSTGTAAYNMKLSENRAKAVMEYLIKKGIDKDRLSAKGYGLTQPIASNDTKEGRAKNRRVELEPIQ
jgi:OmpA-OmpF porin, OOP family